MIRRKCKYGKTKNGKCRKKPKISKYDIKFEKGNIDYKRGFVDGMAHSLKSFKSE